MQLKLKCADDHNRKHRQRDVFDGDVAGADESNGRESTGQRTGRLQGSTEPYG